MGEGLLIVVQDLEELFSAIFQLERHVVRIRTELPLQYFLHFTMLISEIMGALGREIGHVP